MRNAQEKVLKIINIAIISVIVILGMNLVSAWNGPISTPPNGNGYAPINVTSNSQTKQGSLWASGFFTTGGGYFGGDVGIGTQSPEARLDVRNGSCYYKLQADGFYTNCLLNTPTLLTISSDTANYNIATALGNPTNAKNIILTINSGVKVYSTSTSQPALDTGTLPTGSTVTIVNNGYIIGKGGAGGKGGGLDACGVTSAGTAGGNGGDAISTIVVTTIDNTNGYIFGGGGGGGGGGAIAYICGFGFGGGGGGGGAGNIGGDGGTAGYNYYIYDPAEPGTSGGTAAGVGGDGGYFDSVRHGGKGGSGGEYGMSGNAGDLPASYQSYPLYSSGGSGGSAGKAVSLNSQIVTWLGGNNGSQVKGAVQ